MKANLEKVSDLNNKYSIDNVEKLDDNLEFFDMLLKGKKTNKLNKNNPSTVLESLNYLNGVVKNIELKLKKDIENQYSNGDVKIKVAVHNNSISFKVDIPNLRYGNFGYYKFSYSLDRKEFSEIKESSIEEWNNEINPKIQINSIIKIGQIIKNVLDDKRIMKYCNDIGILVDLKSKLKFYIEELKEQIKSNKIEKNNRKLSDKEIEEIWNYLKNNTGKGLDIPVEYIKNKKSGYYQLFSKKTANNRLTFYIYNYSIEQKISVKKLQNFLNNVYISKNKKLSQIPMESTKHSESPSM